jgi:hypothetical protein
MDPDANETRDLHGWTVYADAITLGPYIYMTQGVHSCGVQRVNDCASTLLLTLDDFINSVNNH